MINKHIFLTLLSIPLIALGSSAPVELKEREEKASITLQQIRSQFGVPAREPVEVKESERPSSQIAVDSTPRSESYAIGQLTPVQAIESATPITDEKGPELPGGRKKTDQEIKDIANNFLARLDGFGQPAHPREIKLAIQDIRACLDAAPLFEAMDHNDIPRIQELIVPTCKGGDYFPVTKADARDSYLATLKDYQLEGDDIKEFLAHLLDSFNKEIEGNSSTLVQTWKDELASFDISHFQWRGGFTPLMRAVARGHMEQAKIFLPHWINCNSTPLHSGMIDQEIRINVQTMAALLYRYQRKQPDCVRARKFEVDIPLAKVLHESEYKPGRFGLTRLLNSIRPMDLAALAGNSEMVDLLLNDLSKKVGGKFRLKDLILSITHPLITLIVFSELAQTKFAEPVFKAMGIIKPKPENYGAIARKLMQALAVLYLKEPEVDLSDSAQRMDILRQTLLFGSTEMLNVVASNMAHIGTKRDQAELVNELVSGEKLGMLFLINADQDSIVSKLRNGLLSHAPSNHKLLMRLQRYMQEAMQDQRNIPRLHNQLTRHLIPVLSSIVTGYLRFDDTTARQIIAMEPYVPESRNSRWDGYSQYILGEGLTQLMTREPINIVEQNPRAMEREQNLSWITTRSPRPN